MSIEAYPWKDVMQDDNGDIVSPGPDVSMPGSETTEMYEDTQNKLARQEKIAAESIWLNTLEDLMSQEQIDLARQDIENQLEVIAKRHHQELTGRLETAQRDGDKHQVLVIKQKLQRLSSRHPGLFN